MFDGFTATERGAIFAMQGFAGLILFSVHVLMALGLAIIFGQMGVINMAHGEFMILGAYVTWMTSQVFGAHLPGLYDGYFFVAMALAFLAAGARGMAVEWLLTSHLYGRPRILPLRLDGQGSDAAGGRRHPDAASAGSVLGEGAQMRSPRMSSLPRAPEQLHGISARVAPGEIVAVMGRNGMGKTTLMKALIGVIPSRGAWWTKPRATASTRRACRNSCPSVSDHNDNPARRRR